MACGPFPNKKTVSFYLSRVVAFALLLMPVLSEQRRQLTVLQKSKPKEFSLIFNTHVICVATAQRMFHFFRTRSKETCQKCCVITRSGGKVRRCWELLHLICVKNVWSWQSAPEKYLTTSGPPSARYICWVAWKEEAASDRPASFSLQERVARKRRHGGVAACFFYRNRSL